LQAEYADAISRIYSQVYSTLEGFSKHASSPLGLSAPSQIALSLNQLLPEIFLFAESSSATQADVSTSSVGSKRIRQCGPSDHADCSGSLNSDQISHKRKKRRHGSNIHSAREIRRTLRSIKRYASKISQSLVWDRMKKSCCSRKCFESEPLTPLELLEIRHALHSQQDEAQRRGYFQQIQIATSPTAVAVQLVNQVRIDDSANDNHESKNRDGRTQLRLYVNDRNLSVCFRYFVWAYNVSNAFVNYRSVQRKLRETSSEGDEKCRLIRQWLNDFAKWHEYMPHENIVQLPYTTKLQVYEYYRQDRKAEAAATLEHKKKLELIAGSSYFYRVWRTHESNIVLRRHLKFSICDICARLRRSRDKNITETQLKANSREFILHMGVIKEERRAYYDKRDRAQRDNNSYLSMIMDGSSQYGYNMPHFKYTTKSNVTVEKMKLHVTGVLVHGWKSFMYTQTDRFTNGSSSSVEILQRTLHHLQKDKALPPVFYLQLDNASSTNKNNFLFVYLAWLVSRDLFQRIEVSFLPVGHTHEDVDQMFSRTSVTLKDVDIHTRQDFHRQLAKSYMKWGLTVVEFVDTVIDWKEWIQVNKLYNPLPEFSNIQHFKFEKDSVEGKVKVMIKPLSNATEWTGFPMRDLCGHEILPPQFPHKLPSIVDSGIGSLSVPMATPRPLTDELMIEIAGKMKKGIQLLSALSQILPAEKRLLEDDIDIYTNREAQALSEAWKQRGLFDVEVLFHQKRQATVSTSCTKLYHEAPKLVKCIREQAGDFPHPLDDRIRQAAAELEAKVSVEFCADERDLGHVNERDVDDPGYDEWIRQPRLELLDSKYYVTNAKEGQFVVITGDPIFVAQIQKLNLFNDDGKFGEFEANLHLMEIIWWERVKGNAWTAQYRMEPNTACQARLENRNERKKSSSSTSKLPKILPISDRKVDYCPLYSAYCAFELDVNYRIPTEVVDWMQEHTEIEDEYDPAESERIRREKELDEAES